LFFFFILSTPSDEQFTEPYFFSCAYFM
jgi:hypothetical protein